MNITVRIEISLDRADGSHTSVTEEYQRHAGDNPRMERDEIGAAIVPAVDKIMNHFVPRRDTDCPITSPGGVSCAGVTGHTGNHWSFDPEARW